MHQNINIVLNSNVPCGVLILINFVAQKYFLLLNVYFSKKNVLFIYNMCEYINMYINIVKNCYICYYNNLKAALSITNKNVTEKIHTHILKYSFVEVFIIFLLISDI